MRTTGKSVPRAVASVASGLRRFGKLRSLPLAVLTGHILDRLALSNGPRCLRKQAVARAVTRLLTRYPASFQPCFTALGSM
jgi:hypothetical protein